MVKYHMEETSSVSLQSMSSATFFPLALCLGRHRLEVLELGLSRGLAQLPSVQSHRTHSPRRLSHRIEPGLVVPQ